MMMRSGRFTTGLIVGGIVGTAVAMMNNGQGKRLRRRAMRAGRNFVRGRNGIFKAVAELF